MSKRKFHDALAEGEQVENGRSSHKRRRRRKSSSRPTIDGSSHTGQRNGSRPHLPSINGKLMPKTTERHDPVLSSLDGDSSSHIGNRHSETFLGELNYPARSKKLQDPENPTESLNTPPGLSKRARRRFRMWRKVAASEADDVETQDETATAPEQVNGIQQRLLSEQHREPRNAPGQVNSKLREVCLTTLMRPVVKRWDDLDRRSEDSGKPTHSIEVESDVKVEGSIAEQSKSSETELTRVPYTNGHNAASVSANPRLSTASILCRRSRTAKAISVPSFLNAADVKDAFARFNDYLQDEESDDGDASADEDEDLIQDRSSVSKNGEESRERRVSVDFAEDVARDQDKDRVDSLVLSHVTQPSISSPEALEKHKGLRERVLRDEPSTTLANSNKIQEDIDASTDDQDHLVPPQEQQKEAESSTVQHSQTPFPSSLTYFEGDSLLDTVDEISDAVFTLTEPLPPEKNSHANNKHAVPPSSQFRMTRSATKALSHFAKDDHLSKPDLPAVNTNVSVTPLPISQVVEASSVGQEIDTGDQAASLISIRSPSPTVEITPTRPSRRSKILERDDHISDENAASTRRRERSGPRLSVRPRKPRVEDIYAVPDNSNDEGSDSDRQMQESPPTRTASLAKRRKMTGSSSKHFTSSNPPSRKSKAVVINEQASNEDVTVENNADAGKEILSNMPEYRVIKIPDPSPKLTKTAEQAILTPNRPITRRYSASTTAVDSAEPVSADEIRTGFVQILVNQEAAESVDQKIDPSTPPSITQKKTKRKGTGKTSEFFKSPKPGLDPSIIDRVDFFSKPRGISGAPIPPIHSERFGIIQEKLWQEPFWLLIALTFLNVTTGRAATPVFWKLKEQYPTPEALAAAPHDDLYEMIYPLGLHTTRAKRIVSMAKAWMEQPPEKNRRYRTLHYPQKGDGKAYKPNQILDEDADDCAGALEIGHMPGCKTYAYDSWRMFCRDALRGVAEDYNGKGATDENFVPEWKKVLPDDKELRACVRWMWLREGWIWNHETGERRRATDEEMERAVRGQMDVPDVQELKFAAQAVAAEHRVEKTSDCEVELPSPKGEIISSPVEGGSRCRIF